MPCGAVRDRVSGRLLLSCALHPSRKAEQLRSQPLPHLRGPSLFVHGTRDPFGGIEEMEKALQLMPARKELLAVEGAGHDFGFTGKKSGAELCERVFAAFVGVYG